jgi:hypothetical protein
MAFYIIFLLGFGIMLSYNTESSPSQHLSGETKEKHETRQAEEQILSLLARG